MDIWTELVTVVQLKWDEISFGYGLGPYGIGKYFESQATNTSDLGDTDIG